MVGAEKTRLSSTIASWRSMLAPVNVPNRAAPSLLSEKLTAGRLFSSSDGARCADRVRSPPAHAAAT